MTTARTNVPQNRFASLRSPSQYLSRSEETSSRSLPLAATTTKVNITSKASDLPEDNTPGNQTPITIDGAHDDQRRGTDVDIKHSLEKANTKSDGLNGSEPRGNPSTGTDSKDKLIPEEKQAEVSSGWLGWFSKPANQTAQGSATGQDKVANGQTSKSEVVDLSSAQCLALQAAVAPQGQERDIDPNSVSTGSQKTLQPRSWLGLWGNVVLPAEKSTMSEAKRVRSQHSHDNIKIQNPTGNPGLDNEFSLLTNQAPAPVSETPKSAGWAFWSREITKDKRSGSKDGFGKRAFAGSSSQSQQENAVIDEAQGIPSKLGKRERPRSVEKLEDRKPTTPEDDSRRVSATPSVKPTVKFIDQSRAKTKTSPPNLVLPSLTHTYRTIEKPSIIQQLSRFLQSSKLADTTHVNIVQHPPRIKRALAIVRSIY